MTTNRRASLPFDGGFCFLKFLWWTHVADFFAAGRVAQSPSVWYAPCSFRHRRVSKNGRRIKIFKIKHQQSGYRQAARRLNLKLFSKWRANKGFAEVQERKLQVRRAGW